MLDDDDIDFSAAVSGGAVGASDNRIASDGSHFNRPSQRSKHEHDVSMRLARGGKKCAAAVRREQRALDVLDEVAPLLKVNPRGSLARKQ